MDTIDKWFNESIEQYEKFIAITVDLRENIDSLTLDEILQRCESIKKVQEGINTRDANLHTIMDFVGPEVLDNPLTGDYQRTLDTAIRVTDRVAEKLQLRKISLLQKMGQAQNLKKDSFEYVSAINEYNGGIH